MPIKKCGGRSSVDHHRGTGSRPLSDGVREGKVVDTSEPTSSIGKLDCKIA